MITLAKYNELIEKLDDCVNQYDKMNYQTNCHTLSLANGDIINIKFLKNNLAHLLGVKLDYLKQSNKFKENMNSYDCLKYFIDDHYSFSKLVTEKKLNFDSMFSKHIEKKLDIFIDNIKIRTDDLEFIIKYDSEKTYQLEEISDICDYYIVRKTRDGHNILGIKRSDFNTNIFLPVTSRKYDDFQIYDKFICSIAKKQELTYPYTMKIVNSDAHYEKNYFLNNTDKQVTLDKLIKLARHYDATVSVARDFSYILNFLINNKLKNHNEISILQLLSDNMKGHTILDDKTIMTICGDIKLSDELKDIINLYNDLIVSNFISDDVKDSYSKVVSEKAKAINELEKVKKQLKELNDNVKSLQEENRILKVENDSYQTKMNIYEEAFQKVKSM